MGQERNPWVRQMRSGPIVKKALNPGESTASDTIEVKFIE